MAKTRFSRTPKTNPNEPNFHPRQAHAGPCRFSRNTAKSAKSASKNTTKFCKTKPICTPSKCTYPLLWRELTSKLQFCRNPKTKPIKANSKPIKPKTKPNLGNLGNLHNRLAGKSEAAGANQSEGVIRSSARKALSAPNAVSGESFHGSGRACRRCL